MLHIHLLTEVTITEHLISLEANLADLVFEALVNHEDQVGTTLAFGGLDPMGNRNIRITETAVVFLKIAAGLEDGGIAHHPAGAEFGCLRQLLIGKNRVTDKADPFANRAGAHFGNQTHAIFTYFLAQKTDVVDKAAFVERGNVPVEILGTKHRTGLGADLIAQNGLIDGLGAAVADFEFGDVLALKFLRECGQREKRKGSEKQRSGGRTQPGGHEGLQKIEDTHGTIDEDTINPSTPSTVKAIAARMRSESRPRNRISVNFLPKRRWSSKPPPCSQSKS